MVIVKAAMSQPESIFHIFKECRTAMEQEGIFQWTTHYPTIEIIASDIEQGYLYCLMQNEVIYGVINISTQQEPEYAAVTWKYNEGQAAVIHRLAVHPRYQKQGCARRLMDFAEDYAAAQGHSSVRLDAYSGNERVLRFYENRGYDKRGEVFFRHRSLPFLCYEKPLENNAATSFVSNA